MTRPPPSASYDEDYLTHAAAKIQAAAQAMEEAVRADGRSGACVDPSGMLGRMLDRLAVWNYVAKATLTIHCPAASGLTPHHFWVLDEVNFVASHAIVVAPPFGIVDITVRHQRYDATQASHLPYTVIAADWSPVAWDLANPAILASLAATRIPFEAYVQRLSRKCSK